MHRTHAREDAMQQQNLTSAFETTGLLHLPEGPYANWQARPGGPTPGPVRMDKGLCGVDCGTACSTQGSPCAPKAVIPATQPIVPVPVEQHVFRRDTIIEVPETVIKDRVIPLVYQQEVLHDVPHVTLQPQKKVVKLPRVEFVEEVIEIPVPVGYNYTTNNKWAIKKVPRIIPRYVGQPREIPIEVPELRIVDRTVEEEEPVYIGEKHVRKEVIQEVPVPHTEYRYQQQEKEVPIYRYRPVLDLKVDIPPPLVVPVLTDAPVQTELPPKVLSLEQWKRLRAGGCTALYERAGCFANGDSSRSCGIACCQCPGGGCAGTARCADCCAVRRSGAAQCCANCCCLQDGGGVACRCGHQTCRTGCGPAADAVLVEPFQED